MKRSVFWILILCNFFWSTVYTLSKGLMSRYQPLEISFLRHFFALIPLTVMVFWGWRHSYIAQWRPTRSALDFRLMGLGLLTFFLSPIFQMTGLSMSRAVDGSILIALEPLATIIPAMLILRERLKPLQLLSLTLAAAGAAILSDVTIDKITEFKDARLIGNLLFGLSLFCESGYSIFAKPIIDKRSPHMVVFLSLLTGVIGLFFWNVTFGSFSRGSGLIPLMQSGSVKDILIFSYLGLVCTLFGYLYWLIVLKNENVTSMALTLYLQPVLGMVWGSIFLHEPINLTTCVGGALILVAVAINSRI